MRVLLFLGLLSGCADAPPVQSLDTATRIVWIDTYHAPERRTDGSWCVPPRMEWSRDRCPTDPKWPREFAVVFNNGECARGMFWPPQDLMRVALENKHSESSFAHELMHALDDCTGQSGDAEHDGPQWALVDVANQSLQTAGY